MDNAWKVGRIYRNHINIQLKTCLGIPSHKGRNTVRASPAQVTKVSSSGPNGDNFQLLSPPREQQINTDSQRELPPTASPNTTGWMFWGSDTETGAAKHFCSPVTRSGWGYPAQLCSLELLVVLLGRGMAVFTTLLNTSWLELEHFHFLKSWIFPKILITHSILHFICRTANKSS